MEVKKTKPNIIFIMADALRAGNLGCYGYYRDTSPIIDSLSKQGVLFENVFSSNNVTHKQFLAVLGGRHILAEGPLKNYVSKNEAQGFFETGGILFPEILKKQSYKTYCFTKLYGWQKKGFDYFPDYESREKSGKWKLLIFLKRFPKFYKILKYCFHNLIPKKLANKVRERSDSERVTSEAIKVINE